MELNEIAGKFLSDETREKLVKDVIKLSNDELIFDEYEQMMGDKLIDYEEQQSLLEYVEKGFIFSVTNYCTNLLFP